MGGVSSIQTDPSSSLYLRNPGRFSIASLDIYDPSSPALENVSSGVIAATTFAQSKPLLHVDNNLKVSAGDTNSNIEFVHDPDAQVFPFVLKVPYHPRLLIRFKLVLNNAGDHGAIDNLTFISAKSLKQLDSFITTEFFHNPNIQNEDNVALLGDFKPTQPETVDFVFEWSAKQQIPPTAKGWKTVLCFAEYNKREHSLQQLCNCTLWFEAPPQPPYGGVPPSPSPPLPSSAFSSSEFNTTSSSLYSSLLDNSANKPRSRMPSTSVDPTSPVIEKSPHQFEDYLSAHESAHTNNNTNNCNNRYSPSEISQGETIINVTQQQQQQPQASEQSPQSSTTAAPEEPIDAVLQREKKAQLAVPRPDGDSSSQPEDGPLFRATISSLEKKTGNLKMKTKKLLKRAILLQERQINLIEAHRLFIQALHEIGDSEVPAFKSIIYSYFGRQGGQLDLVTFLRDSSHEVQSHLIDPLRKLYDNEIKAFDNRKREFDDESSQYYSWLSRYLSVKQEAKGKKKVESDSKYLEKRKAFELCRFDYFSYMQDLHGGRKQQDVAYELALYAESEANRVISTAEKLKSTVKPQLDSVVDEVKDANKDWSRQRTEREVRRRALERSIMSPLDAKSPAELFTHDQQQQGQYMPKDTVQLPSSSQPQQPPTGAHGGGSPVSPRPNSPGTAAAPSALSKKDDQPKLRIVTNNVSKSNDYPRTPKEEHSGGEFTNQQQQLQTPKNSIPGDEPLPVATFSSSSSNAPQSASDNIKKEGLLWAMSRPGGISDPISNLNKAGWHKFWVVLAEGKLCEYTNWKQGVVDLHNEPINLRVALVREARNSDRRFCFEVVTPNYKRVYQTTSEDDMQAWIRAINNGITSSLECQPDEKAYPPMHPSSAGGAHFGEKIQRKISLNKRLHRDAQLQHQQHSAPPVPPMIANTGKGIPNNSAVQGAQQATEAGNSSVPGSAAASEEESGLIHKVRAISPSNSYCADCGSSNKFHRSLGSHISKIRSLKLDTVSFNPDLVALIKSVSNDKMNQIWEAGLSQKMAISGDKTRVAFITEKYVEKKYVQPVERPNSALRQAVVNGDLLEVIHSLASRANADSADEDNVSMLIHSLRVTGVAPFTIPELLVLNSATVPGTVPDFLSDEAKAYLAKKVKH